MDIDVLDPMMKFQYAIESFSCDDSSFSAFCIDIANWSQSYNTYSTLTGSSSHTSTIVYDHMMKLPISFQTIGIPLASIQQLNNNEITVIFRDVEGRQLTNMIDFVLSIVVWPVPEI
jgi:hypothetical protein